MPRLALWNRYVLGLMMTGLALPCNLATAQTDPTQRASADLPSGQQPRPELGADSFASGGSNDDAHETSNSASAKATNVNSSPVDSTTCGCQVPCANCNGCGCGTCGPCCRQRRCGCFNLDGWLDAGYLGNTQNPPSRFNGPYNAIDRDEIMFNQAYLVLEKPLPTDGSFGLGLRGDVLYGFDFFLAQSNGFELNPNGTLHWNDELYGLALPQIYGQVGNDEFSVKVGHFYTIVGYESVMSPQNFFYSHSYSYQFAGPFTHWGGLLQWQATDNWQVQAGLINGWNQLDGVEDHLNFLGAIKYVSDCEDWWTSFAIVTGDEFNDPANLPIARTYANRTRFSWLYDVKLSQRTEYVFHYWHGFQDEGAPHGGTAPWYGIDQYLYYRLNCRWRAGLRFEWFRDEDGTRVGLNRPSNPNKAPFPGNFYSLSVGVNWTPWNNLIVRPEIRSDWFSSTSGNGRLPFDDGNSSNQLLLGFDVIYSF